MLRSERSNDAKIFMERKQNKSRKMFKSFPSFVTKSKKKICRQVFRALYRWSARDSQVLVFLLKQAQFVPILVDILTSSQQENCNDTSIQVLALFSLFRGHPVVVKQLADHDVVFVECIKSLGTSKIPIRQVGCVLLASLCTESPLASVDRILGNSGLQAMLPLIKSNSSHVPQLLIVLKCILENKGEPAIEILSKNDGIRTLLGLQDNNLGLPTSVTNNLNLIVKILSTSNKEVFASCKQMLIKRKMIEAERPIVKHVKR